MQSWCTPGRLLELIGLAVGAFLVYEFGESLVHDAYWASRGGQDWFFDTASRVAIPFVQLGVLAGLTIATLLTKVTEDRHRIFVILSVAVWICVVINIVMMFVDHPLLFVGI